VTREWFFAAARKSVTPPTDQTEIASQIHTNINFFDRLIDLYKRLCNGLLERVKVADDKIDLFNS